MAEMIYSAINAAMADIGAIQKDKKNKSQGFMYRGVDDVMNALNPAFIEHKIFVATEVLDQRREERKTSNNGNLIYSICKVQFTFYSAEDGSSIKVITIGEGMDSGDKATNKAMSVAFKYACFQLFCIPTEEMSDEQADARPVDPDRESHTTKPPAEKPQKSADRKVNEKEVNTLYNECGRTGIRWKNVCYTYNANALSDLTVSQYNDAMKRFAGLPDKEEPKKEPDPETIPPDQPSGELPWAQ